MHICVCGVQIMHPPPPPRFAGSDEPKKHSSSETTGRQPTSYWMSLGNSRVVCSGGWHATVCLGQGHMQFVFVEPAVLVLLVMNGMAVWAVVCCRCVVWVFFASVGVG